MEDKKKPMKIVMLGAHIDMTSQFAQALAARYEPSMEIVNPLDDNIIEAPKPYELQSLHYVEPMRIDDTYAGMFDGQLKLSNNQKKKCAKGLHTFRQIGYDSDGSIKKPIYRCLCGVLMSTRKMDPNLNKEIK